MASLSIFSGRVGGSDRKSDLQGMFVEDLRSYSRQKNSFRIGGAEQPSVNRRSLDESQIIKNNNIALNNDRNRNMFNNNRIIDGTATVGKARPKPPPKNGDGMGARPVSTLSLPDLNFGSKELAPVTPLQHSCRVIWSDSTMPSNRPLVPKRLPLSDVGDDDSEASMLVRRLEELIVAGDVPQLEKFIHDHQAKAGGAPVLVNTRLEGLSFPQGADLTDCTPLGLAVLRNDHNLVSALIRLGADVTMAPCLLRDVNSGANNDVMTSFHLAVTRFCSVEVVRTLLKAGCSSSGASQKSEGTKSANGIKESDTKLQENFNGDVEKIGEMGIRLIPPALFFPVLQYIAKCTDKELARTILEAVENGDKMAQYINVKDDYGNKNALHVACKEGTAESVKLLIEKGIDINARDKTRKTALMYAARRGRADVTVKTLLSRDADVTAVDSSGRSALHYSVMNEHLTTTELLLKAGCDPNLPDLSKMTPIDHAICIIAKNASASNGKVGASEVKILTLLVEHTQQSKIELSDANFRTAATSLIDRYSDSPDANTFATLKRLCADQPDRARLSDSSTGEFLLHYACRYAYASSIVQWIVSTYTGRCDLNCPGDEGYPPLILAVRAGANDSVAILLRAGANVNVTSAHEPIWTGLWMALSKGNGELARNLLEAGANPKLEMNLKYLRIAGARQGQQAVTAEDPLMLLATNNCGKVNTFEFALHKGDLVTAHKLITSLKSSPYVKSEDNRKFALDLLIRCQRSVEEKNVRVNQAQISEIRNWITSGKLPGH